MTLYIHRTSISQRYWFVVEIEGGGGGGGKPENSKEFPGKAKKRGQERTYENVSRRE